MADKMSPMTRNAWRSFNGSRTEPRLGRGNPLSKAETIRAGDSFIRTAGDPMDIYLSTYSPNPKHSADQDFISPARVAIPELIAEIRRLRQ
jgi:hypothetical protein